jgi:hypothetical protein
MSFNLSYTVGYLTQTSMFRPLENLEVPSKPALPAPSKSISITLYPRWYKHVIVEWSVPADWGRCIFNVLFSPSESGPFKQLNGSPINGNHLKDVDTQEYSKISKAYYVVEAILLDKGNAVLRSAPATWETSQSNWVQLRSQEIQRREYVLLSKFTGSKSYIFRRKSYGERCPDCWNPNVEKAMKDNCPTCIGTTFKGGYFLPYNTYVQFDPSPDSNVKTYFGKFEPVQIAAWTVSIPRVFPDDIVVRDGNWDLFRVDNIAQTELQGRTVRQMLQLTELSKNSIEFELIKNNIPEFPDKYL